MVFQCLLKQFTLFKIIFYFYFFEIDVSISKTSWLGLGVMDIMQKGSFLDRELYK